MHFLFAQEVSGYVFDSNNSPLADVNISITELQIGTVTSSKGYFQISGLDSRKYILVFSSLGYKTVSIEVNLKKKSKLNFDVILEPEVFITDEIVIGAEKNLEESVLDIPIRTKILNISEIDNAPAISISKIFEGISGVNVYSEAGMFSSTVVSLRGLGGKSQSGTLVVVDGSPVNKSDAGSVDWSMIDKDNISTVEVIKGPGSVIFGSNAMGGIINITTRKPKEAFNASISSSYGTYNTYDSKLRLSGVTENSKLYWKSFLSYRSSDGYVNTPDEMIAENDIIVVPIFLNEMIVSGFIGYKLNNKNYLEFSMNYFDNQKGRGVKIYEDNGANTQRNTIHSYLRYRGNFGNFRIFANAFVLYENYFRLNEYYSDGEYALYEIKSDRVENGGKIIAQYNLSENAELDFGAEIREGSVNGSDIYYTSTDVIHNSGNLDIYSGFAQIKFNFFKEKITLVPGIRFDHAVFSDAEFSIENPSYSIEYLSEFQFVSDESVNWSSFSPKISLNYSVSKNVDLYASVARGFRAPVLDDLCRSDQVRTGFRVANPEITPEYLNSFETGVDFKLKEKVYLGVSGYYNIGKDFMYLLSTGDSVNMGYTISPIYQTSNIGEVRIYGIETDVNYHLNKKLNLFANYTYNQSLISEFVVNPDGAGKDLTGKYLTDVPTHKVAGGFTVFTPYVNVSAFANYIGERWINDDNTVDEIYLLTDKYPAYTTLDVKLRKELKNFDFNLTIDNIVDKIYTNSKGYKCPGRMIIFEVKYEFKKSINEE
jgi:iron complex outermembrane receptor protein